MKGTQKVPLWMDRIMGFFDWLFRKKRKKTEEINEEEVEYEDWDALELRKEDFRMEDTEQREKYVRCLLEQMQDAEQAIQTLTAEYAGVTSYLKDMEEIEALPSQEKEELLACARQLRSLEQSRANNPVRKSRMSEDQYLRMEQMEGELEEGLKKLREAEDYQGLIRKDLKRLDAERQAYEIRQKELSETIGNARSVSVICISAMAICMLVLLFFQFGLHMDAKVGYILAGLLTAGVLTVFFVRFREADAELARVNQCIRKLILLQNRVKIRYVNNTNLLDYLYMKYMTGSSEDLEKQLQLFYEEREERHQYEQMIEDMNYYQKELMRILRRYQLYDPTVWIHRADALLDQKEMVEIRHRYITQRQKLRKQMENNRQMADRCQEEIHGLVNEYPAYAKRILEIVEEYEPET